MAQTSFKLRRYRGQVPLDGRLVYAVRDAESWWALFRRPDGRDGWQQYKLAGERVERKANYWIAWSPGRGDFAHWPDALLLRAHRPAVHARIKAALDLGFGEAGDEVTVELLDGSEYVVLSHGNINKSAVLVQELGLPQTLIANPIGPAEHEKGLSGEAPNSSASPLIIQGEAKLVGSELIGFEKPEDGSDLI